MAWDKKKKFFSVFVDQSTNQVFVTMANRLPEEKIDANKDFLIHGDSNELTDKDEEYVLGMTIEHAEKLRDGLNMALKVLNKTAE